VGVNLHIENLVLEGFPAGDRHAIAAAIQGELARLLGAEGVPPSFEITGPVQFRMERRMAPGTIGERVAQSIYSGWSRSAARGTQNPAPPGRTAP
jgi:hypothetical protein